MIDLDGIDGRCNACEDFRSSLDAYFTIDEIKDLSKLLRQAEKDAARYRWLRHMAEVDGATEMMLAILISDDWDSAIDEAMNASNN